MKTKNRKHYTTIGTAMLGVGFLGTIYLLAEPNVRHQTTQHRQATNDAALDVTHRAFSHIVRAGFTHTEQDPHARFENVDNSHLALVNLQCNNLLKWRNMHAGMVSSTHQKMLDAGLEECIKLGKTALRRPIIYSDLHAMAKGMSNAMQPATAMNKTRLAQEAHARDERLKQVPGQVQAMSTWTAPR